MAWRLAHAVFYPPGLCKSAKVIFCYFVGTALVIIALIVVCVVVRAWRIANENPVKSIKVE